MVKVWASPPSRAAWIEIPNVDACRSPSESPPSRAAWIEMRIVRAQQSLIKSPPSRAAWIEMDEYARIMEAALVAAFTGGVD